MMFERQSNTDDRNWFNNIFSSKNPEDDLLIDVKGDRTIYRQGYTIIQNFTSEDSLTVENGTLNPSVTVDNANLNSNSNLGDGTVTGVFNNREFLRFESNNIINLQDATINNYNTIVQENLTTVYLYSSHINNLAGSIYKIQGGSLLTRVPNESSTFSLFDSSLRKITNNTGTIDVQINSNNSDILVKRGILEFTEGGEIVDSNINLEQRGRLIFGANSGEYSDRTYIINNITISGKGLLEIGSQIYAEDTLIFGNHTKLSSFGTLQGNTFINPDTGKFIIEGIASDTNRELEATFTNRGIIHHKSPGLFLKGGTLINEGIYKLHGSTYGLPQAVEGGLEDDLIIYDVTIDAVLSSDLNGHITTNDLYGGKFVNTGTISNIKGFGDYSEIAVTLEDNNGIIKAAYGTLALSGDDSIYEGTNFITRNYLDDAGNSQVSTIRFNGGSHLFKDNVSFKNNRGNIQFGGSATEITAENTLDLYGEIIWGDLIGFSTLGGNNADSKIVNHGTLEIATGLTIPAALIGGLPAFLDEFYIHTIDTTLVNKIGATINNSRGYIYLDLTENGTLDNNGTYNFLVEDGAEINIIFEGETYEADSNLGGNRVVGDGVINNNSTGLITKTGSKAGDIETVFNNYGTVRVETGELRLSGGGDNSNGKYFIAEDAQLNFTDDRFEFTNTEIVNNGLLKFNWGNYIISDRLNLIGETIWRDDAFGTAFSGAGKVINEGNLTLAKNGVRYEIATQEFINKNDLLIAGGTVHLSNQLTNNVGATITLGDGNPAINELNYQTENKLVNEGILQVIDGSRSSLQVLLENKGLLDIKSGKLALSGGSFHTGDSQINIAANSTLEITGEKGFRNGDTNQFQNTTINNLGEIIIDNGTVSDAIALEVLDELTLSGDIAWKGGRIAGTGSINNTGTWGINGLTYLSTTLNNSNSIVMERGTFQFRGGTLNNLSERTFEMEGGEISVWLSLRNSSSFNNAGMFRKTKHNDLTVGVNFDNTGILEIAAGKLTLTEGGEQKGLIKIAQDATLVLDDGREDLTFIFDNSSRIKNQGSLRIAAKIVTQTNPLILQGDTILDFSGELEGVGYVNQGNFSITGRGGKIESNLQNTGEVNLLGFNEVTLVNATLENLELGIFNFEQGEIKNSPISQNSSLINKGIFNKLDSGTGNIEVDFFNNGGEINIEAGTLLLEAEFTQTSGKVNLNNAVLSSRDILNFAGGFVTGEGIISSNFNPVEFDRANIDIGFSDGDVGTIKLRGDYQETNNTKHYIDITQDGFDQLIIEKINSFTNDSGNAHLGGSYEIRLDETFKNQLVEGDRFEIVKFENYTLDSNGIDLINTGISNGLSFAAEFDSDSLDLVVVSNNSSNINVIEF